MNDLPSQQPSERQLDSFHSFLRIAAIAAVILIHTSGIASYDGTASGWIVATATTLACRWCIPVFFMITGWFLLQKDEPILQFFKKRAARILPPLIFYTIAYLVWDCHFQGASLDRKNLFLKIANVDFKPHLWFLYTLIGVYLSVPWLRHFTRTAPDNLLKYTTTAMLFIPAVSTLAWAYSEKVEWKSPPTPAPLHDAFTYLGYMLLPFVLKTYFRRISSPMLIGAFLTPLIISLIATSDLLLKHQEIRANALFWNYSSPIIIFQSCTAYLLLFRIFKHMEGRLEASFAGTLAAYTFPIFLLHQFFVDVAHRYCSTYQGSSILAFILSTIGITLVSIITVHLLGKVKVLRPVLGL